MDVILSCKPLLMESTKSLVIIWSKNHILLDFQTIYEYIHVTVSFGCSRMTNFLFCFRTDVANPLIGDISEYERFVKIHTQRTITQPIDHGPHEKSLDINQKKELQHR